MKEDLPHQADSNKPESQNVDLPSVAYPSSEQQVHPSPPSKDLPASGQSLAASAPGVTKTFRQMQEVAPGEPQVPRKGTPSKIPVYQWKRGTHAPRQVLNRQPSPNETLRVSKTRSSRLRQDTALGDYQAPQGTPSKIPVYQWKRGIRAPRQVLNRQPSPNETLRVSKTRSSRLRQDTALGDYQAPLEGTPSKIPVYQWKRRTRAPRQVLNRQPSPNETLGVSKTRSSRLRQDTALGDYQAPLERTPPELPAYPNANRECTPPDEKGGHDPINRQRAPNGVSPPLVRHRSAAEPPRCQSSP